jgi:hypothetical protein
VFDTITLLANCNCKVDFRIAEASLLMQLKLEESKLLRILELFDKIKPLVLTVIVNSNTCPCVLLKILFKGNMEGSIVGFFAIVILS